MQHSIRFNIIIFCLCTLLFSACTSFRDAKQVIVLADSLDQNEHLLYTDTASLNQVIHTLDNPLGKLFARNTLGKAHYYMGRNLSMADRVAEAAGHYVEADRLYIDDPIYRGRINSCMAHIAKQNEDIKLALIFFERANRAFYESGKEWYYAHTLLDVCEFHTYLHSFCQADSVLQIAQSFALDSFYQARFYETKGLYLYEQQLYDSALVYFHQALEYWEYEEDKFYTYKKLMQVYLDMNDFAQALPYAQIIVEQSANPNELVNAYYCLMQDAKTKGDIERLSLYAHARQDANVLLNDGVGKYHGALTKLKEHIANPYPYRWAWIALSCSVAACLLLLIGVMIHRRHTTIRLQVATNQIDELSISAQLSDIRATYPSPCKQWNDYNELKKDLDAQLHDWLCQLDQLHLSNRENVFCAYMLIYPQATLDELADWMHYSTTGVSTFKRRIAQKIGVPTRELYRFLHDMLQK